MKIKSEKKKILFGIGICFLIFCQIYVWVLNEYIDSFWQVICFAVLASMYVQTWKNPPGKRELLIGGFFSLVISVVFVVGEKVNFNGDVYGSYVSNYMYGMLIGDWIGVLCWAPQVFIVLYGLCCVIKKVFIPIAEQRVKKRELLLWILSSGFIMLCWLPYLFAFYPGVVVGDSLASINQALNASPYTNHYPVLYTLFVKIFLEIGGITGSYNHGVFLYSCVQCFLLATTAGYFVYWMIRKRVPWILIIMVELYFAFSRIFAVYAISMWKDPLFSAALLLYCILLLDIGISNGEKLKETKTLLQFIVLGFVIIFWRNNGIFLVAAVSLLLAFVFRKKFLKMGIGTIAMLLVSVLIQGPIYDAVGIGKDTVAESLGVPIQQIANVVVNDRELTAEQEQILFQVFPEERWKEFYTPASVDSIKFHEEFNQQFLEDNVGKFLGVWFQLLPSNLDIYVDAYLMETIGFWQIGIRNSAGYYYFYVEENNYNIQRVDMAESLLGIPLEEELMWWIDYISTGALVWLVLVSGMLIVLQKKYVLLWGVLPAVLLWLTIMLATPIAFSLRYIFLLAFGLPFFVLLPFLKVEKKSGGI